MKDLSLSLEAWDDALDKASRKIVVPSVLRTADWERVPLAIRERSFFSAAVASAHDLQYVRDVLVAGMKGVHPTRTRPDGSPMTYSSAEAIADIRQYLGVEGDSGKLTDFGSYRRQRLIQDFQTEQAYSYGRWKRDLEDPDILNEFPAQRLTRVEPRKVPRTTWMKRWAAAGNAVGWSGASKQTMVALKTSSIWRALSRFGTPYPPFDFGSGMGLEDVSREGAEALGIVPDDWNPEEAGKAALEDFNQSVEASIKGLDTTTRNWLQGQLGELGHVDGDRVRLVNSNHQSTGRGDLLGSLGISATDDITTDQASRLIDSLRKPSPLQVSSAVSGISGARRSGTLTEQFIKRQTQEFLNLLPPGLAASLPAIKIEVRRGLRGARGDYSHQMKRLRLSASSLTDTKAARKTIFHELIHWVHDHGPQQYRDKIRNYFESRTRGENLTPLKPWNHSSILGKPDKWMDADGDEYAGRVYPWEIQPGGLEVLTRHLEKLADPDALTRHWNHRVDNRHYWREAFLELITILEQ